MLILAMEESSAVASVALLRDGRCIAEEAWEDNFPRRQRLFAALPAILKNASVEPDRIDALAVGLGPGSFSGIRMALAAAQAFALPDKKPVHGISSGELIAWDALRESNADSVIVAGDARRGRIWIARFALRGGGIEKVSGYSLVAADELGLVLVREGGQAVGRESGCVIVSPDWTRIGDVLASAIPPGFVLIRERRVPSARTLGELVGMRLANGRPCDPLVPLYLHPPVDPTKLRKEIIQGSESREGIGC